MSIATLASYAKITGETFVETEKPSTYLLSQDYPNPFNPSTKIKYSFAKESYVRLIIYDALGREVTKPVDQHKLPDIYEVDFNSSNYNALASGVYVCA